jgi:hypothetical protein
VTTSPAGVTIENERFGDTVTNRLAFSRAVVAESPSVVVHAEDEQSADANYPAITRVIWASLGLKLSSKSAHFKRGPVR